MTESREYRPWERSYADAIVAADTLWGGDITSESGRDHFIADMWTTDMEKPGFLQDPDAVELQKKAG